MGKICQVKKKTAFWIDATKAQCKILPCIGSHRRSKLIALCDTPPKRAHLIAIRHKHLNPYVSNGKRLMCNRSKVSREIHTDK